MRVDVGGNCAFNESMRDFCPRKADCTRLFHNYAFYLAFENANCDEYVTEKFLNLLEYPILPIILKRAVYKKQVLKSLLTRVLSLQPPSFAVSCLRTLSLPRMILQTCASLWRILSVLWTRQPSICDYLNGALNGLLCGRHQNCATLLSQVASVFSGPQAINFKINMPL